MARLLEATIAMVSSHGLAGATIPRIAKAAKVAPASVYRRFRDKESLLRTAFLDVLQRSNATNAGAIPPQIKGRTLEWVAGAIARSLIAQYRRQPVLMKALVRFVESDDDEEFRSRSMSLIVSNAEIAIDAIVKNFGKQIAGKNPRRSVTFVILAMANIVETQALEQFSLWREMLPLSDDDLATELKRLFLGYVLNRGAA